MATSPYERNDALSRDEEQAQGLGSMAGDLPADDLDVEVSPDAPDGFTDGVEFEVGADGNLTEVDPYAEEEGEPSEVGWFDNLATSMEESDLNAMADELIRAFEADEETRKGWLEDYKRGLNLLGLKIDERTEPWQHASGVFHPLLAEALVRYVSEAILETYPVQGPAECSVIGTENPEEIKRAARVKTEMNYLCTKKMPEDRSELEMTMWRQALAGSCFRKVYYDSTFDRPRRMMVPAEDFIIQYGASDLWTCPRYTHRFTEQINEVMKKIHVGSYRKYSPVPGITYGSEANSDTDEVAGQERHFEAEHEEVEMLEMYVDFDVKGFEHRDEQGNPSNIACPYIITVDRTTGTVVSIYRNHTEEKPFQKRKVMFVGWKYLPGFGIYGTGLCQLLGGTADAATSLTRQIIDAGTLSNIPAGFKSRSLRILGDDTPLRPGELRDVDLPPGGVTNSIEWIPAKEPSATLVNLLGAVVDEGRRIGSVADMKIGDSSQGSPVGTTLAVIERALRIVSAVQARNNEAMAQELDMLKDIVANDMPDEYEYTQDEPASRREDFSSANIIPVADPSATTMAQRIMRYTAAEQIASRQPQLYDMARLHRQMIEQLQIPNADKIVPLQDDFVPMDPVTENMRIIRMQPVKAFLNQDHDAHLAAHMSAIQDPLIQQVVGQTPTASAIQAAAAAHIQEHIAYAYRSRIQQQLGFSLPDPDATLPPEQEAAISRFVAEASQKVLQQSQYVAAQQKAQQEAQDPLIQLQQMELQIKQREVELDHQSKEDKIRSEQEIATMKALVELVKAHAAGSQTLFNSSLQAAGKRAEIQSREQISAMQHEARAKEKSQQ